MGRKSLIFGMLAMLVCAGFILSSCKKGPSLSTDKKEYKAGENITVTFTAPDSYADNAWVGIIPSNIAHGSEETNDQNDIAYEYLKKRTSGTLTFTAPDEAGSYDMRMHDTDSNGKEVFSVSFTVK